MISATTGGSALISDRFIMGKVGAILATELMEKGAVAAVGKSGFTLAYLLPL